MSPVGKIAENFECRINKNALLQTVFLILPTERTLRRLQY